MIRKPFLYLRVSLVSLAVGALLWLGLYSVENRGQTPITQQALCMPVELAFFAGERIHVKCVDPKTAIRLRPIEYFSVSTQDSNAQTIFGLLQNNLEIPAGQGLTIVYDNNPTANPSGCLPSDCRKITGIVLPRTSRY